MYLTDLINVEHLKKSLFVPFDEDAENKRTMRLFTLWLYLKQNTISENAAIIGTVLAIVDQAIEIAFEETDARR